MGVNLQGGLLARVGVSLHRCQLSYMSILIFINLLMCQPTGMSTCLGFYLLYTRHVFIMCQPSDVSICLVVNQLMCPPAYVSTYLCVNLHGC